MKKGGVSDASIDGVRRSKGRRRLNAAQNTIITIFENYKNLAKNKKFLL